MSQQVLRRTLKIETAPAFIPLLQPKRFKGASGGRGACKSHFFAETLIEDCLVSHTRAACVREIQNSIKDSVKQLLEDKINTFRLEHLFKITDTEIVGPNDSLIIFKGLQSHTATSIKSLEGFTRCWIEEAQSISQRSLDMLTPTFRKDSELSFSWNPISPKDPVDRLFRENIDHPDFVHVKTTYKDNPWFPNELKRDMERDKVRDPDKYAHVWLGDYLLHSEARVFRNWKVREFDTPKRARFYFGADWGFSVDPTVLVRCFIEGRTLFVDYEAWKVGCDIDYTPALFAGSDPSGVWKNPLGWEGVPGAMKWSITADSSNPQAISYLQRQGFTIEPSIKGTGSVEEGIEFLKSYDIIVHPRCVHVIDELQNYSYEIDKRTEEILPKLADRKNHCIAEGELITCKRGFIPIENIIVGDEVLTRNGFRKVIFAGQTDADRHVVRLWTSVGEVVCTPDHEVWTKKGFVRADTLRYDDEIIGDSSWQNQNQNMLFGTVENIGDIQKAKEFQIENILNRVDQTLIYIEMFGSFIKEEFKKVMKFIISMKIHPTMILKTSNVSLMQSTWQNMSFQKSDDYDQKYIWEKSDILQKSGINQKKDGRSTVKLVQCLINLLFQLKRSVKNVKNSFYQKNSEMLIVSARMPVKQPGDETQELMILKWNAFNVKKYSQKINMRKLKLVQGRVLTVTDAGVAKRVFDLTVEQDHEFFVGGVLVSNCIDALRYSIEDERRSSYDSSLRWVG